MPPAISQSLSIFSCHSWLLQSPVCFQPQLGTRVCFDSARTVHVQCTHSARPQCTGWKHCKYHRKWPLGFKTKKKQVSDILFNFMSFQQITCYLHHLLRVHCGVHCACTVRALSKHTHSACSSLLLLHWLLEHPREPWCCAVLAAAVCLLVSLCARSWNTFVNLGVLPLLAPWRACLPAVGTPL